MSAINELYKQLIIDHGRKPRNFGKLEKPTCCKDGFNPLCGDQLTVYVKEHDGIIDDLMFEGEGCAISTASASLMTQALKGKTVDEANVLFKAFHSVVVEGAPAAKYKEQLGKLIVLTGVAEFPARVKCATLAWHTLDAALKGNQQPVSTE